MELFITLSLFSDVPGSRKKVAQKQRNLGFTHLISSESEKYPFFTNRKNDSHFEVGERKVVLRNRMMENQLKHFHLNDLCCIDVGVGVTFNSYRKTLIDTPTSNDLPKELTSGRNSKLY